MHEKKNDDQEEREAEWKTDSTFTFYREIDLEKRFSMTGRSSSFNGDSWKDIKLNNPLLSSYLVFIALNECRSQC